MPMKLKVDLETANFEERIAERVVKAIGPLLTHGRDDAEIFSVITLAEYLGVSKQWVYDKKKCGKIPHFKAGRLLKFRKREIDRWVASQNVSPANQCSGKIKKLK